MIKAIKLIGLYSTTFLLVACGGGGGGGDASPPQTLISLTTSNVRAYKQGDTAIASLKIHNTANGQTASGDITVTVGAIIQNPFGIDCRSMIYSGTLTGPGGTVAYSVKSLFYQDNDNAIYECGEFNDTLGRYVFITDTAISPNGIFKSRNSPMKIGDSTTGMLFFDDGTWEDCTETVVAKENVSIPIGLYESYKISQTCSYSDGDVLVNSIWTIPSIFNIKEVGVIDGLSLELIAKSYNFN